MMLRQIAETLVALERLSRPGLEIRVIGEAEETVIQGERIWFSAEFVQTNKLLFIVDFLSNDEFLTEGRISTWNLHEEYKRFFTERMTWKQALKQLRWVCKQVTEPVVEMFVVSTSICQLHEGGYVVQTHGPFTKEGAKAKVEELLRRYALVNELNQRVGGDSSFFSVAILPLSTA